MTGYWEREGWKGQKDFLKEQHTNAVQPLAWQQLPLLKVQQEGFGDGKRRNRITRLDICTLFFTYQLS